MAPKISKLSSRPSSPSELGHDSENRKAIGRRLAAARGELGIKQKEMASAVGASERTVKGWEGGRSVPSGRFASGLARLGINVRWLMENEGPMLLAGGDRDAHADWVGSITGDEEADRRRQGRSQPALDSFVEQQKMVDDAAVRCAYEIPQLTREALIFAVRRGMAPEALDAVVSMLKAQAILDREGHN